MSRDTKPFVRVHGTTYEIVFHDALGQVSCSRHDLARADVDALIDELVEALREPGERPHLDKHGRWQSDKFKRCPPDLVPLSVNDPTAQDLLLVYAMRRRPKDADFSADLESRLARVGFKRPLAALTRDDLGRVVREAWVAWAKTDPRSVYKPHWLLGYDALDGADREADRCIGEAVERGASVVIAALHNELIKASDAVIKEQKRAEAAEAERDTLAQRFENEVRHSAQRHNAAVAAEGVLVELLRSFGPLNKWGEAQPLDEVNVRQMRDDVVEALGPEVVARVAAEEEWPTYGEAKAVADAAAPTVPVCDACKGRRRVIASIDQKGWVTYVPCPNGCPYPDDAPDGGTP